MLLTLIGCAWMNQVQTECAPLRLSTGRPECEGISLCIETTTPHPFTEPHKSSTRSWFQNADGVGVQLASASSCPSCAVPNLRELVCADVEPEQTTRR